MGSSSPGPHASDLAGSARNFITSLIIAPTILEAAGLPQPSTVNGVAQQRVDGISMAYTFDAPQAPDRHTTQYFEMMGNRAIYHDGWMASTTPIRATWQRTPFAGKALPTDYDWELYDGNTNELPAFKTGQIFAVNEGILELWWANLNHGIQWPSLVKRYNNVWATSNSTIVIASLKGGGAIDPVTQRNYRIYYQNNAGVRCALI